MKMYAYNSNYEDNTYVNTLLDCCFHYYTCTIVNLMQRAANAMLDCCIRDYTCANVFLMQIGCKLLDCCIRDYTCAKYCFDATSCKHSVGLLHP